MLRAGQSTNSIKITNESGYILERAVRGGEKVAQRDFSKARSRREAQRSEPCLLSLRPLQPLTAAPAVRRES